MRTRRLHLGRSQTSVLPQHWRQQAASPLAQCCYSLVTAVASETGGVSLLFLGFTAVSRASRWAVSIIPKRRIPRPNAALKRTERLRVESGDKFPERVTAFRPEMAVHGRYNLPCPRCGGKIQRIRYAANETNHCPHCQTGGKLLADRSLSRPLRKDWPKSVEDLEDLRANLFKT